MRRIAPIYRINNSLSPDWSLDAVEVEKRRIQYGTNDIVEASTNRWRQLAKDTIMDPMIWFLVGTSFLFAILGNYNQTIILLLATLPLIGMDAFLHWRTQASTQSLNSRLASVATVIRNKLELKIPSSEIVPGDLIVLNTGGYFPADGIIIAGKNLQVEESALTGESFPVAKKILNNLPQAVNETIIEYDHWGFAGTRLLTGHALLRVLYTGKESLYGEIVSSALQTTQARTPLQSAIAKLVLFLIVIATLICFILAVTRYYQGFGFIDAILSAATLAVAALPDEFPVVFTFFLGVGVYRLARKNALVRRAVSVENIGRITCICSDKTGTITEGRFQLVKLISIDELDNNELLYLAAIASRIESGDPLDLAISNKINEQKLIIPERLIVYPFTEERKRETGVVQQQDGYLIVTKGSPETILSFSILTENEKNIWLGHVSHLAMEGYKVIACAKIFSNTFSTSMKEPNSNFQFAGILAFTDPPRKEVYSAVSHCRQSNIHVLMITGDHPDTARSIAKQIGLGDKTPNVITANDAENLLLKNGGKLLRTIDVIARAIPSQKLAFVQALQAAGDVVAVTGDGVNDVPALKAADIGIAMGERGTQSAREVASIVLLDDNFGSIVNAIAEGRQLFKNLKLSFKYLLMIHIPFVFSAAIIPLFGFPLMYYPIHIVFIELILHPTSLLVFQNLPESKKLEPIKRQSRLHFFSLRDWLEITTIGLYSTLLVTLSYVLILKSNYSVAHARGLAFTMLGFTSAAITIGLSRLRTSVSRVITFATLLYAILLVQIPILAHLLDLHALSFKEWSAILLANLFTIGLINIYGR